MDQFCQPEDPPLRTQQILAAATKQFDQLSSGAAVLAHNFVRKVVRRVVVHPERIEIEVGKQELLAILFAEAHTSSAKFTTQQNRHEVIRLLIDARLKRHGGEMRLVLPPNHLGHASSHASSSLLKALARGRTWYEWIVAGEVSGKRAIAKRLGLTERYVGRVLECAFLAPDIVESILDGSQPADLTFAKLTRGLPTSWIEQRKQLGFPSAPPSQ